MSCYRYGFGSFQQFEGASAALDSEPCASQHAKTQFHVNVAQPAMFCGGEYGSSEHLTQASACCDTVRYTKENVEHRRHDKSAADTEEPAQETYRDAQHEDRGHIHCNVTHS
jgi:alkylhydroperoxidase family enzyme